MAAVLAVHCGVEVGQCFPFSFRVPRPPFDKEADGQPLEHAKNPDTIAVPHTAAVFICGDIKSLMGAILNPPVLTIPAEPLLS